MLQALSELEDRYSFGPSTGAQGFASVTETTIFSALGPDEMPMDLDGPGRDLTSVEAPSGCSLSSCPHSSSNDSDVEDGASHRWFSRLLSERM